MEKKGGVREKKNCFPPVDYVSIKLIVIKYTGKMFNLFFNSLPKIRKITYYSWWGRGRRVVRKYQISFFLPPYSRKKIFNLVLKEPCVMTHF